MADTKKLQLPNVVILFEVGSSVLEDVSSCGSSYNWTSSLWGHPKRWRRTTPSEVNTETTAVATKSKVWRELAQAVQTSQAGQWLAYSVTSPNVASPEGPAPFPPSQEKFVVLMAGPPLVKMGLGPCGHVAMLFYVDSMASGYRAGRKDWTTAALTAAASSLDSLWNKRHQVSWWTTKLRGYGDFETKLGRMLHPYCPWYPWGWKTPFNSHCSRCFIFSPCCEIQGVVVTWSNDLHSGWTSPSFALTLSEPITIQSAASLSFLYIFVHFWGQLNEIGSFACWCLASEAKKIPAMGALKPQTAQVNDIGAAGNAMRNSQLHTCCNAGSSARGQKSIWILIYPPPHNCLRWSHAMKGRCLNWLNSSNSS